MCALGIFGAAQPHAFQQRFGSMTGGAVATDYKGVNQFSERSSGLAGIADSKVGFLSMWFQPLSSASINALWHYENPTATAELRWNGTTGLLQAEWFNGASETFSTDWSSIAAANNSGWHNVMLSFDGGAGVGYLALDGADATVLPVFNNTAYPYTSGAAAARVVDICGTFGIGMSNDAEACISEVFFHTQYVPLATAAPLFISGGHPVNPGANANALGVTPLMYVPSGKSTNLGSGGNLTAFGTPPVCSTTP